MEAELPGSPRVLTRRQAGALPLPAQGRAGPLEPLLGPSRWHRLAPAHPGRCAKTDLLVRRLELLSELLRRGGLDRCWTRTRVMERGATRSLSGCPLGTASWSAQ